MWTVTVVTKLRHLILGRIVMTKQDSVLKSRDITLLRKFHIVKDIVFLVVIYRCESWTIKKAECQRIDTFELWCWRRLLSLLDRKEIRSVNVKGNQPWILIGWTDAEAPILWRLMRRVDISEKTLMLSKIKSKRRGWQRMNKFNGITDSMYMSLSKLQEIVNDEEA